MQEISFVCNSENIYVFSLAIISNFASPSFLLLASRLSRLSYIVYILRLNSSFSNSLSIISRRSIRAALHSRPILYRVSIHSYLSLSRRSMLSSLVSWIILSRLCSRRTIITGSRGLCSLLLLSPCWFSDLLGSSGI